MLVMEPTRYNDLPRIICHQIVEQWLYYVEQLGALHSQTQSEENQDVTMERKNVCVSKYVSLSRSPFMLLILPRHLLL
jgi:hypothetical protein